MRVIGVVDLQSGQAVHARRGIRERSEPVRQVAGVSIEPGDAIALAESYTNHLGVTELYAADLDAIRRETPNDAVVRTLAAMRPLWLDTGISTVEQAIRARALGADGVVVGLETLGSYDALREICRDAAGAAVAFSLDLRNGKPILAANGIVPVDRPEAMAARAADAGASTVIVIDLARVGAAAGVDLVQIDRVRKAIPGVTLLAGGGIRGPEEIIALADAGCDGVLLATTLQDGRISAADVAALRHRIVTRQAAD